MKGRTLKDAPAQLYLLSDEKVKRVRQITPFKTQLLKWIGNKQRFAHEIISYFPEDVGTYFEPFIGSGAVLATFSPDKGVASDSFAPLIDIWNTLKSAPDTLKSWYRERWERMHEGDKLEVYEQIKASYNSRPNAADLLFISRSAYGGVIRFRQADGYISTPCGVHDPIEPAAFAHRVDVWRKRVFNTTFLHAEYEEAMTQAKRGDLIYCDPPYSHTQSILYGAHAFSLENLFQVIASCKARGVHVVLSIDGTKRSGNLICDIPLPQGLFEREVMVDVGRSMLKRFQMNGKTLEGEMVADRLLLTY